jgi:hypothetical protein
VSQKFSHEQYALLVEQTIAQVKSLSSLKGGEYAGDVDRLANFRRNGERLGLPMETVWAVYAAKHWDAVMQYVQDLCSGRERERLEPLAGRLDDIIVYCILFKAMLEERDDLSQPDVGLGTISVPASLAPKAKAKKIKAKLKK